MFRTWSTCCGPYSLKELKERGAVEIKDEPKDEPKDEWRAALYVHCGGWTNPKTGKYEPRFIHEINGPADIPKYSAQGIPPIGPEKAEVIGSCPDKSRVADLGSRGDWH